MATHAHGARDAGTRRLAVPAHLSETLAYACALGGVYVAYGFLWYYGAYEKLIAQNGDMPGPVASAFNGRFLDSVPGLNTAWLLLGLFEAVAVVLFLASLLRGEFMPQRAKPVLIAALGYSIGLFGVMAFAESMAGQFDTVGSLFGYLGVTAVIAAAVALVSPGHGRAWLSLGGDPDRRR